MGGVAHARWAADSRHVLVVSDFRLYLSIWPLGNQSCAVQIRHPKYPDRGLAFSPDGEQLALLRRSNCRDSVSVLECQQGFGQLAEFAVGGDCADLVWAASDSALVLWERPALAA